MKGQDQLRPYSVCYLCGQRITEDATKDHVPPKQFYPRSIRQAINLDKIVTLAAHSHCQSVYGRDEEYFVWALTPLARGGGTGDILVADNAVKFHSGEAVGLAMKTLKEFEQRPSGLILPGNRAVKRVQINRIQRVVWKIVRGLYYIERHAVLSEDTRRRVIIREPENRAPSDIDELLACLPQLDSRGVYPRVFDYKYMMEKVDGDQLHMWFLLLWDRIIVCVLHM